MEGLTTSLQQDFDSLSFPDILIKDLRDRMAPYSIRPEDMLRNRIYPVGSALGFLLDHFHIDWKSKAQQADSQFTFEEVLSNALKFETNHPDELVNRSKTAYDYDSAVSSTDSMIGEYLKGFKKELSLFEAQTGYRIQVDFNARSLSRSRSSRAKKWLVEKGTESLCNNYEVYTLKNNDLLLQIENTGVLENNDWDSKKYSIAFFASVIPTFTMDGKNIAPSGTEPRSFQSVELKGANFTLKWSKSGTLSMIDRRFIVTLNE